MAGNHISERLISKLRTNGILPPKGTAIELRRTFSNGASRRAGKWTWYAVNAVTKEHLDVGSRFTMQMLLDSDEISTCETPWGLSVNAAGNGARYEVRPGQKGADPVHPHDLDGLRLAISEAQFASRDPETPDVQVISIRDGAERVVRRYENGTEVKA